MTSIRFATLAGMMISAILAAVTLSGCNTGSGSNPTETTGVPGEGSQGSATWTLSAIGGGEVTDDRTVLRALIGGDPLPTSYTVAWTALAGSNQVSQIVSSDQLQTTVGFPRNGVYQYRVTVTDSNNNSQSQVVEVTVNSPDTHSFTGLMTDDGSASQGNIQLYFRLEDEGQPQSDEVLVLQRTPDESGRYNISGLISVPTNYAIVLPE